ncbi:cell division transport system permease protein [Ruminiclostridium sufflavum DSM 19573]|uniref:Cell division protein FtsX n=1 Tax=Ruminiclostridium sufflavum DSM 19573 TaxID=1121337 RepID=A0A318XMX5_9FIRM|nr:permease-like cell division protein FtsX [Ruminiclostridium sufflavum]PYG88179.1 cell division transport system permease protein [Ruminiclostridium sufflavum DSM 19573]
MGMKIRSIKYILKTSILNASRNRLMSLASISIISAALILFGVFYLILVNLNYNISVLSQQPTMQVFCLPELTDEQVDAVQTEIAGNEYVESFTVVSKKEAFEQLKKYLADNKQEEGGSDILSGYDESFMNVSFIVKVDNPENSELAATEFLSFPGVENVEYSQKTIDVIQKVSNWVKIISIVLIGLLLVISLFIISNTIKLTVFARRKEINIMKYIGATDWFIRWPFIYEGIFIGIIGAIIAFVLVAYIYSLGEPIMSKDLAVFGGGFATVKFKAVCGTLALIYMGISTVIGASGSALSIRKHLHV